MCVWYARNPTSISSTQRMGQRQWHAPHPSAPETNLFFIYFVLTTRSYYVAQVGPKLTILQWLSPAAGMMGVCTMPASDSYFFNKSKLFFLYLYQILDANSMSKPQVLCFQFVQIATGCFSPLKLGPHFQPLCLSPTS